MTIQFTWFGVDGTTWDLTNGKVVVDGPGNSNGVEGLGLPKFNRQTIESAGRDGQRRTGQRSRASARQGYLPILILGNDGDDWHQLSSAWWNSWDPDLPGTLTVTMDDGTARSIDCFLVDDDTYAPQQDPTITGTEETAVTWIADSPFWYGDPVSSSFVVTSGGATDFFNGGAAPPFNLAAGNQLSSVQFSNTGDIEAWPVYTILGPATAFSITLSGQTVSGTITVPAGATLTIDTDPAMQTAILTTTDGTVTNVTPQLSSIGFASIPAGLTVPATVSITGSGTLTISYRPRYRRAW